MGKYILTSIVLLPLLLCFSHAAQTVLVDPSSQPYIFSSDEGGTSSYLGVDIADVTSDRLGELKLKEEKGVEVTMVDQDAPAGKAGIKEHDVILTMNGTPVESAAQLRRMIHETPPGRVVTFGLSRDGQPVTVKVQLADRHNEFSLVAPKAKEFHFEMPEMHIPEIDVPGIMVMTTVSAKSGLTVENITPQLGEFFGVKDGHGVLVRSVEKGSRGDKAGFRAGDVIVKVDSESVHDTSDFSHAVRSRKTGSVSVGIVRDKKEQTLNLTLPAGKESGDLLEEESLDDAVRAETAVELSEVETEIAKLRPQMELAAENARKSAEQLRQSLCEQQRQLRDQSKKQQEELRKELKKQEEQLRQQMRLMRQEMRRTWLDL